MNAEEFLKGLNAYDSLFEIDNDCEYSEQQLISFAERYHKKIVKLFAMPAVSNRTLITEEIVLLKKPEFINKDGDWCDADRLTIKGEVKYFAYKNDLYGC